MAKIGAELEVKMVYRASAEKQAEMQGWTNGIHRLEFAQDDVGNWVIGKQCADDPAFAPIAAELRAMTEIPFVAKKEAGIDADDKTIKL